MADTQAAAEQAAAAIEGQESSQPQEAPEQSGGGYLSQSRAAVARAIERAEAESANKEDPEAAEPAAEQEAAPAEPEAKEAPAPKEAEVDYSKAQAEFERRENALRQYEARLKQQEQSLAQDDELKRSDPLKWLQKNGIDFNDVAHRVLNGTPSEEEVKKQEKEHIKSLEQQITELKQYIQGKEQTQALESYKKEAESLVGDDEWVHDYCKLNKTTVGDLAAHVLGEYYQMHGKALTAQQVIDTIKADVKPVWDETYSKYAKPAAPPQPERPTGQTTTPKPTPATLTNDMSAQSIEDGLEGLSWEEKKEKLAAALKWTER